MDLLVLAPEVASSALLVVFATAVVYSGSMRSSSKAELAALLGDEPAHELSASQAWTLPLIASASLIAMFLFWKYLQWILVAYNVVMAFGCTVFLLRPLLAAILPWRPAAVTTATTAVSAVAVFGWMWSGSPALSNVVGVGLCVAIMVVLRLPSLKVATIALAGLLLYDVYWVYFSHLHWSADGQQSVMVAVAQQEATSPVAAAVEAMPEVVKAAVADVVPASWWPARQIALPNKLTMPTWVGLPLADAAERLDADRLASGTPLAGVRWFSATMMLGLGDVALPGLLVALARRMDVSLAEQATPLLPTTAAAAAAVETVTTGGGGASSGSTGAEEGASPAPTQALRRRDAATAGAATDGGGGSGVVGVKAADAAAAHAAEAGGASAVVTALPLSQAAGAAAALVAGSGGNATTLGHWWREAAGVASQPSLLRSALAGYAIGLTIALVCSRAFRAAQPALLYLVPCTLAALVLHARRRPGLLPLLWRGGGSTAAAVPALATAGSSSRLRPA